MRPDRRIDEVQPYTSLAHPTRLLAIVTVREAFVALQVSLSARQTACPHPLWFTRCSRLRCTGALR